MKIHFWRLEKSADGSISEVIGLSSQLMLILKTDQTSLKLALARKQAAMHHQIK